MKNDAIVAVVGRPNVGKSTFFNRVITKKEAIVSEISGVTRDRKYYPTDWNGEKFTLVDTGGIVSGKGEKLDAFVKEQSMQAIKEAQLILLLVDRKTGPTIEDVRIAKILHKTGKPVLAVINKADDGKQPDNYFEFRKLGFADMHLVSAAHGMGIGDLLDEIVSILVSQPRSESESTEELVEHAIKEAEMQEKFDAEGAEDVDSIEGAKDKKGAKVPTGKHSEGPEITRVAIVGKPNVGKSSLLNLVLKEERAIISDIPGTTRDTTDSHVKIRDREYILVDTAGIRKKSKVHEALEFYSVLRAVKAIENADIVVLVIDIMEGATEQDQRISNLILERGKGVIVVCNKIDLVNDEEFKDDYLPPILHRMRFLEFAPLIKISAKTGRGLNDLFSTVIDVEDGINRKISTPKLNNFLQEIRDLGKIPSKKGRVAKIKYMTQVGIKPPTFAYFVNDPALIGANAKRYFENSLRKQFTFNGAPIRQVFRKK